MRRSVLLAHQRTGERKVAATDLEHELLTISEAAILLKVSTVTIQRWLKQGRLRAYHLGPRYIRIRRSDLDKILTPLEREEVESTVREITPIHIEPLTEDQVRQGLEAIKEAKALREEVRAKRGGQLLSPSWPLIRKAREERSKRL